MKRIALTLIAISLIGCGSAPISKPKAVDAFRSPPNVTGVPEQDARKYARQFFGAALAKAENSDSSSTFDVSADALSAFALALASGGALTDAHSDLYKGAGALLGIGLGANQYFKPEDQRAVYFNAAEASYCSGVYLLSLAALLDGVTLTDIATEEETAKRLNTSLKGLLYSRSLASADLDPFTAAALVTAAVNADVDTKAKLAALKFIKTIPMNAHIRSLEIYKYEVSEINKTAYNLDETLKTIARMSVTPDALLKAYNAADPANKAGAASIMVQAEYDATKTDFQPSVLAQRLPEIIEVVNAYTACSGALRSLKTGD